MNTHQRVRDPLGDPKDGHILTRAISFGLLTTELVINALKHAFPDNEGAIIVTFEAKENEWMLSIEDDGIGYVKDPKNQGLGTSIVASLAKQLGAALMFSSSSSGTKVSLQYPQTKLF